MPFKLPILLSFQGSAHLFGVGSFSTLTYKLSEMPVIYNCRRHMSFTGFFLFGGFSLNEKRRPE